LTGTKTKNVFKSYKELVSAKRKRNEEYLSKSGLLSAADTIKDSINKNRTASQRGISKIKNKSVDVQAPRRKSKRLQGKESDGFFVEKELGGGKVIVSGQSPSLEDESKDKNNFYRNRINDGSPLSIYDAVGILDRKWQPSDDGISASGLVKNLFELSDEKDVKRFHCSEEQSLASQLQNLKVDESDIVAKVCPERIYSVTCHPSTSMLVVAAGDKVGNLGLWSVDSEEGGTDGVSLFKPHGGAINNLEWNHDGSSLFSVSYDGSVREMDVEKQIFSEVFAAYDDSPEYKTKLGYGIDQGYNYWIQYGILDHRQDRCMFLSTSTGDVIHIDLRAGSSGITFNQKGLSEKKINTVHLHPNGHTLATCGLDRTVKLWDVRKFPITKTTKAPIAYQTHGRSIDSAFFSPSGKNIIATTKCDTLSLTDNPHLKTGLMKCSKTFRHNNQTGRWLTTFMARWHPTTSEELFVVGSMNQPRQIDVYDASKGHLKAISGDSLSSVFSRCCFHPQQHKTIIVGGNSSGRVIIARNN